MHPAPARLSNSILNNAIGNVFATEKTEPDRKEMEKNGRGQINETMDEDEENGEF